MSWIELKKGDKVRYLKNMPYKMSNGQIVNKEGEEVIIRNNIKVNSKAFKKLDFKIKKPKIKKEDLKKMSKDELINFADENKIEVDKRKGEEKLREEIINALKNNI